MESLATGIVKNTTGTGAPSIAIAADFPTLNQNTTGTASTATNLAGGSAGSIPYQSGTGTTAMLSAGTAGYVLKSNGSSPPSWEPVSLTSGLSGSLPVSSGGTGAVTLTGILKGNGTSAFTTVTAPTGGLVGTTDAQTLTNKTFGSGTTIGVLGTPSSGTLTNCTSLPIDSGTTGTLPVSRGGSGATTLTGIIKGNGTSAFTAVTAPTGDLVGTTDTQTLTNKTFGSGTTISAIGTPSSGTLTNCTGLPIVAGTTGTLSVARGGTGAAILSGIVKANGTNAFTAVTQPAGDLVGTTATQTLTNKTLGSGTTVTDLGTPNSGTLTNCTSLPLGTGVSGTLLAVNGGTGQTSYVIGDILYASSSTALSKLVNVATGNALLSGGVGVAPAYGKVGLTTHVSGTLPVANGGTGVAASAYGQIGGQTAGTSTAYTTTYAKLVINTSLDAAAQFDVNGANNRLRYTGSATRKFLVFASMDMFSATDGAQFSIKIAKNGTVIDATQCNAVCPTKASVGIAKLVSNWIIEFATNDYVEIFVASVGGAETGTPQRMRLVATPVF
jgi:hypothetical protein